MDSITENLPKPTKKNIILAILIVSIFCLAWLINGREVTIIRSDKSVATVRAGETVNFSLIFEQDGGFFDEHFEMVDIEEEGNWEVSLKGTSIYVPANSKKEITFIIHVPDNAEDGDRYHYGFALIPKPVEHSYEWWSFSVYVNNSVSGEVSNGGGAFHRTEGGTFQLPPLVIIPAVIIVICLLLLMKINGYFTRKEKGTENNDISN
jgi:hypothetical protein